jgi:prepilin-type N-terminal cleavage/methylation domain-containing protein
MNKIMNKKGVTLVELIVAMAVGLIIMAAIYSLMNTGQKSSSSLARKVLTQQDARAVMDLMALEIGMASYNPGLFSAVWVGSPSTSSGVCADYNFVQTRKGLQIAGENQILVAMDLNEDGIIGNPGTNEYIFYEFTGNSIRRRVSCGTPQAILGGIASGTRVLNDATTPLFQYFAASDTTPMDMTTPLTDLQIASIRRIRINIVVEVETQSSAFRVSQKTYTTDIFVRNHALDFYK